MDISNSAPFLAVIFIGMPASWLLAWGVIWAVAYRRDRKHGLR